MNHMCQCNVVLLAESRSEPLPQHAVHAYMNTSADCWAGLLRRMLCAAVHHRQVHGVKQGPASRARRQKQKERLSELEQEVARLAQQSNGARCERAALLERNLKLKVRLPSQYTHIKPQA